MALPNKPTPLPPSNTATSTNPTVTSTKDSASLRPKSKERIASHGRGGAGNIKANASPSLAPVDLHTPTIKSQTYTTGRGGTGNMAANDPANPDIARAAQDVDAPASAGRDFDRNFHVGRGGAANVAKAKGGGDGEEKERERDKSLERGKAAPVKVPGTVAGGEKKAVEKTEKKGERKGVDRAMNAMGAALSRVRTNESQR